ncbi:SLC5 family protein [Tellurirhabdus rosea]|uniref:SLC5 family protein n=1 Tax=Tellurirhabdus rosea TaxID=2674997 RepID=UPI00225282E5|nr:sodium/solute symporter [Tellurirhabdus rosea]
MLNQLQPFDLFVLVGCLLFLFAASAWAGRKKKNSEDYFMAGRSLRWWSVAGSIYGTNIHAQQIIGMMGIGYSIGFAQSHYEVLAVPAILILCYIFIPLYRKREVFTLSQFLEHRYNENARLVYTVLIVAFILVQLIAGFYIGSRTLGILFQGSSFEISYLQGILLIAAVTVAFTVFGGMDSVVVADNILTILMVFTVIIVGVLTLAQPEIGGLSGLLRLDHSQPAAAQKMHLYLPSDHPKLPWTGIFTGLIIQHLFYWTTNQYQVQRVLAASTDRDAQLGTIAAGFLKLTIPFFSIASGVAAFYIFNNRFGANSVKPDDAFLKLMETVVPSGYGIIGLTLAGLTCAIFSAIYSMMNSVTTLLAFDIYKKYLRPNASDRQTVLFGRISVVVMCAVATLLTLWTYDPNSSENFFLKLADQSSYFKPSLVAVFFIGIVWAGANPRAAVIAMLAGPVFGLLADLLYNNVLSQLPFFRSLFGEKLNFLHRVFVICTSCSLLLVELSRAWNRPGEPHKGFDVVLHAPGMRRGILLFLALEAVVIGLVLTGLLSPQFAAWPGAVIPMVLFLAGYRRQTQALPILQSDLFYAGLLSAISVWILYYFA